ncbi:probable peptidoglycan muropeptide transporter SLC46 isoform X2 [Planococcus citri]
MRVWNFFNLMRIVDSFKVVFSKDVGKNRIVVLMLVIIFTLVFFTTQGEKDILYLFLRGKFKWQEKQFSFYVIYRYTGVIIGSMFCSIVMSKYLNMHDGLIGIISGTMDTIAAIGYLIASEEWHLYVVPLFDVFHGTAMTVSVSFYSKYYKNDEFGRLNSVVGIFALIMPASRPAYNVIFQKTLDYFPSALFLLSVVLDVVIVLLYCASYTLSKKLEKQKPIVKEECPMLTTNRETKIN